jgi:hypothetical protein
MKKGVGDRPELGHECANMIWAAHIRLFVVTFKDGCFRCKIHSPYPCHRRNRKRFGYKIIGFAMESEISGRPSERRIPVPTA